MLRKFRKSRAICWFTHLNIWKEKKGDKHSWNNNVKILSRATLVLLHPCTVMASTTCWSVSPWAVTVNSCANFFSEAQTLLIFVTEKNKEQNIEQKFEWIPVLDSLRPSKNEQNFVGVDLWKAPEKKEIFTCFYRDPTACLCKKNAKNNILVQQFPWLIESCRALDSSSIEGICTQKSDAQHHGKLSWHGLVDIWCVNLAGIHDCQLISAMVYSTFLSVPSIFHLFERLIFKFSH